MSTNTITRVLFVHVFLLNIFITPVQAQKKTLNWFYQAKYGVFVHYLNKLQNGHEPWNQGKITSWDSCINEFDVNKFANQVHQTGAGYVIFTTLQADKYLSTPNATYEKLTGYKRGDATPQRDLIKDLYTALSKYNIKLFLYVTGDGPKNDRQASKQLKNPSFYQSKTVPFKMNDDFVNNWSLVLKDLSQRYKNKITGWWVDGSYPFIGYNDKYLGQLAAALKSGNPSSIIAFNSGVNPHVQFYTQYDDYLAGEMNDFYELPTSRFVQGKQWHIVSFIGGPRWACQGVRKPAAYMIDYLNKCHAAGGVVTMEMALNRDGSFEPDQLEELIAIKKAIKPNE